MGPFTSSISGSNLGSTDHGQPIPSQVHHLHQDLVIACDRYNMTQQYTHYTIVTIVLQCLTYVIDKTYLDLHFTQNLFAPRRLSFTCKTTAMAKVLEEVTARTSGGFKFPVLRPAESRGNRLWKSLHIGKYMGNTYP